MFDAEIVILSMRPMDLSIIASFPMPMCSFASTSRTIDNPSFLERRRSVSKSSLNTFRGHASLSVLKKIAALL